MADKAPVSCSPPLDFAMDKASKNQLIDLIADLARGELGERASDEQVIDWLQSRLATVWQYRGDKGYSLYDRYANYVEAAYEYQRTHKPAEGESFFSKWSKVIETL